MKIEKLNENQIRCILDKSDLEQRELQLSELAYGSSKAKALFRDMMEQASMEFGFEVDNIPLMIEAIPVSFDCLILVVTKVEDPDELDTRFSRFSSMNQEEVEDEMMEMGMDMDLSMEEEEDDIPFDSVTPTAPLPIPIEDGENEKDSAEDSTTNNSEGIFDIMAPFNEAIAKAKEEYIKKKKSSEQSKPLGDHIYAFESLDEILTLSDHLVSFYPGDSMLYKDNLEEVYYLVLLRDGSDQNLYNRACTICSDHGQYIQASYGTLAYFKEHFKEICHEDAIETLHHLNG